ncbi:MAG: hypothetical protein KF829_04095 [Ferruginibacter sp.]|nr:hypothetical protein [Ferruginibacter sp.]
MAKKIAKKKSSASKKTVKKAAKKTVKKAAKNNGKKTAPKKNRHLTFIEKVRQALQEWSNENEREIEEDDESAQTSGL